MTETHNATDAVVAPTMADMWQRAVERRADATFLVWEDGRGATTSWTYAQFDELAAAVAGGMAARGVGRGDVIHLALANSPGFVAVWLAALRAGAVIAPSDPRSTTAELADHARLVRPRVAIVGRDADRSPYPDGAAAVVQIDEDDVVLDALRGDVVAAASPGAGEAAAILFTSGTTSAPKGVVVTQANYAHVGTVMAAAGDLGPDDRQLVVLPLFHANAQYYSFSSAIVAGASVALRPRFSASGFTAEAARLGATHASLFAAPIRMILAHADERSERAELRTVWYAQNLSLDEYERFAALVGCRPRQLYGMTETIAPVFLSSAGAAVHDVMGVPAPGTRVEVRDPAGRAVRPGEVGELVVTGVRGHTLFREYLRAAEQTTASFDGVWFRTGDQVVETDEGFRFHGRRSDVLKVSGENVSTVEIEEAIGEHPLVREAAVVGEADPIRDEVPVAFVVLAGDADPAADVAATLSAWCEERLAPVKRPRRYTVVDELPRTSVGKIRKVLLTTPQDGSGPSSRP